MSTLIVGDFRTPREDANNEDFTDSPGSFLKTHLAGAGLDPAKVKMVNLFPFSNRQRALGSKAESSQEFVSPETQRFFKASTREHITRLEQTILREKPNVIVALGNIALTALTNKSGIKRYRGAAMPSRLIGGEVFKVLPTWHPSTIFRQYSLKPVFFLDLEKALYQSGFREIRNPSSKIWMNPTLDDLYTFHKDHMVGQPFLSCDIETKALMITEVGYSDARGENAIVIPFYHRRRKNYWPTHAQEREAWRFVAMVNQTFPLVGQNFNYDMAYFWRTMRLPCPKLVDDTMLMQHSLYPELEKGLGFLGSAYTNNPSWKFLRGDHDTLKQADD